jgi:drug/metabolite transporter (DMT)-like permease
VTGAHLQLLAAAVLFSTGGVAIKSCSLPGWQIAGTRSAIAAITLFVLVPNARRLSARTLLVSCVYAGTLLSFVVANTLTTAAHSVFLQATAPLYLTVLSPLVLGERLRGRDGLLIATIGIGMWILFLGHPANADALPHMALGNRIAAAGGLSWALTLLGLRWLARGADHSAAASAAWGNVLAALIALPMAWPLAPGTAQDWSTLLFLGVAQVGLAYFFVTRAITRLPALTASLLLMLEPALNPLWTWAFLREHPGGATIIGGAIVLVATIVNTLLERREAQAAPAPA